MASIGITASIQIACNSDHHVTKKQKPLSRSASSFGTKQATHFVSLEIEGKNGFPGAEERERSSLLVEKPREAKGVVKQKMGGGNSSPKMFDEVEQKMGGGNSNPKMFDDGRWKNGTWDLNMFVKNGRMDWDGVIVAEARRRKFLELYPEVATTQDPVVFRSSVIPWWAWIMHSHLSEAELLNGRAAMVGFLAAYLVDMLTGLDLVGQTGNVICKAGLFLTVVGVILFRRKEDLVNIQKLADEASFYDKQWQASWQDQDSGTSKQTGKK